MAGIRYIKPTNDTVWPDPDAVSEIEHWLRYNCPGEVVEDRLFLASVCAAYNSLATHPCGVDQLARLRKFLGD